MSMTLVEEGRRLYFRGAPYAIKDELKSAGCKWDADSKGWWMSAGRRAEAEALLARLEQASAEVNAELPPASGSMVDVTGNTYPVRDKLRALGGSWDAGAKVWRVPESRLAAAKAIVAGAPKDSNPPRYSRCKQCGARPNRRGWPRIYRNGICSDCYKDLAEDY